MNHLSIHLVRHKNNYVHSSFFHYHCFIIVADQRQSMRVVQREQRTHVEHDFEKEKHTLRLMKGFIAY